MSYLNEGWKNSNKILIERTVLLLAIFIDKYEGRIRFNLNEPSNHDYK